MVNVAGIHPLHPLVLIIGAMDREIEGLLAHFDCTPDAALLGVYPAWFAQEPAFTVAIVQTHVGDINAAIAASEAIRCYRPDAVLKLGCVGGHGEGVHTGDCVTALAFFHSGAWITRDIENNAPTADAARWQSVFGELPYQVNRENLGGRAHVLQPDARLTAQYGAHLTHAGFAPVPAYIGGSNMWFFDHAHMRHVLAAQVPDAHTTAWVADMESYAIAQACAIHQVPFTGIYRVSNSDYYVEPYDPTVVAQLFDGRFARTIAAFVRQLGTTNA